MRLPIREELIPPRGRETHNETDSRREMSPDRAWWFDVPEAPTINPRRDGQSDDRGGRAQLGGDRSISLSGGSQDQGAGVGTLDSLMFLDTFFKSAIYDLSIPKPGYIVFHEPENAVDDGPDVQVEVNEGRGVRVGVRVQEEAREHRTDHTK